MTIRLSPELKRARAIASGVKGLRVKEYSSGLRWYWEPSPSERKAGWRPEKFGRDRDKALAGADARNQEIETWRLGGAKPREIKAIIRRATIAALIDRYRRERLPHTAASSQRNMGSHLNEIERLFGDLGIHELQAKHVHQWRDRMMGQGAYTGKGALVAHHTAHNRLRALRTLYNWAMEPAQGLADSNPANNFALETPKGRADFWELEDIAIFKTAAMDLGLPSMALACELAVYTGQRPGDLRRFSESQWQRIHLSSLTAQEPFIGPDGQIVGWVFSQGKTKTPMQIAFLPELRAQVEATFRTNRARDRSEGRLETFLIVNDKTGLPWDERAFIRAWSAILDHCVAKTGRTHMATLQWRDFRRTRVVHLKRFGFEALEIASITGHSPKSILKMLEVYGPIEPTATANALARAAKLQAAQKEANG